MSKTGREIEIAKRGGSEWTFLPPRLRVPGPGDRAAKLPRAERLREYEAARLQATPPQLIIAASRFEACSCEASGLCHSQALGGTCTKRPTTFRRPKQPSR